MSRLTIFTAPKPFTDPHIATIQRNAIGSWQHLGDGVQVLLIGDEPGTAETAADLGVRHLPEVARNRWGTPLISDIFSLARTASESELLAYANADVLLTPDFLVSAERVAAQADRFLVIGQRWDLEVRTALDFDAGWVERLRADVRTRGRLHRPSGSDYFIFPRDCFIEMPAFAVGRAGWDNWMIYHARAQGWAVVDATGEITVIHQDHDYGHLPGGQPHYLLEESDVNRELAGGKANMYILLDANRRLVNGRIRTQPPSAARLLRRVELWLTPHQVNPHGLRWALARRLRHLRRRLPGQPRGEKKGQK